MSTITHRVYDDRTPLTLDRSALASRPDHGTAVLVSPAHFDVHYRINPYMGGRVDAGRALDQWMNVRRAYERYADRVRIVDPDAIWSEADGETPEVPASRLPDLVFAANLAVPTADGDGVVRSRMATDERAGEPQHFRRWALDNGYEVESLSPTAVFEGTGDAIWHPGRRLLWGGYGVRTERAAYDELAVTLDAPVVTLELSDPHYYHLNVCFAPLTEGTALIVPEAFTPAGRARIDALFDRVVEVPEHEATGGLACNSHCVDGDHVLLASGNPETERRLREAGFTPVPLDTSEFQKAGGSVCCLSLLLG